MSTTDPDRPAVSDVDHGDAVVAPSGDWADPIPSRPFRGFKHARRVPGHRVLRAVAMVMTAVLTMGVVAGASAYFDVKKNLHSADINQFLKDAPTPTSTPSDPSDPFSGRALNILVIGTDYRDAANAALAGEDPGARADTTIILHISEDRKWMEFVSIPRDLLVTIPSCTLPNGKKTGTRYNAMFNSAFQLGAGSDENLAAGAACTSRAVTELTGIQPTNYIIVKMTGVVDVVNALGGVTMCMPEPVKENPAYGWLNLPAGKVKLDGNTSLEFLRARHGKGFGLSEGSDITRIERQQAFLNAMQRQIEAQGLLGNPKQTYSVAMAVLKSLIVDKQFENVPAIVGLAWSLRNLNYSNVVFSTMNVGTPSWNPNRLIDAGGNKAMWQRFIKDTPPPGVDLNTPTPSSSPSSTSSGAPGTTTGKTGSPGVTTSPAQAPSSSAATTSPPSSAPSGSSPSPSATPAVPKGVCP